MTTTFHARVLTLALAAATTLSAAPASALPPALDPDVMAPGASPRAIVGFTHDVDDATIARLAGAGITGAVVLPSIDAVGVLGPRAAYRSIAGWADVAYVDDDSPVRFQNFGAKKDTGVTRVRGGHGALHRRYDGKGVVVAVIDTGVDDTHPDLAGQVLKHVNFEPSWFFDMITDGTYSDRLSETTGNAVDSYGHGTHVAGIVAGTGAAGQGADFSGVAPGAKLVNLKIADVHEGIDCTVPCDLGWEINALVAYEWLIEHRHDEAFGRHGIRVATNSWSIFEVDSEVEPITLIVAAAARRGIINLFAASNDGPGPDTVAPGPNRLEEVITVAATCKVHGYANTSTCDKGDIASFSSRGPQVDIAAPGVGIYSTMAHPSVYAPTGGHSPPPGSGDPAAYASNIAQYTAFSGTSMATPHIAGIVALMLQAEPRLGWRATEGILTSTARDEGKQGFDTSFGFGAVNGYAAVVAAERFDLNAKRKRPLPATGR